MGLKESYSWNACLGIFNVLIFHSSLDRARASSSRRTHAIATDPISKRVAGTGEPPTIKRWVAMAPTIVGTSKSAPNGASEGTRSGTAEPNLDRAGHIAEPLPHADRVEQRHQCRRASFRRSA